MAPSLRGVETALRIKAQSTVAPIAGTSGWKNMHFYTEGFQPGRGLVADPEIGGARNNLVDPVQPVEALPKPVGNLSVCMDRNQLPWWLASLLGAPTTDATGGPTVYEHVFTSGKTALQMYGLEIPFGAGPAFVKFVDAMAIASMTFGLAKEDGFRKVDLGTVQRSVRTDAAVLSVTPAAAPARDKVTAAKGLIKINGTGFGNVLGGNMTINNGLDPEMYMDDTDWPSSFEIGEPTASIAPEIRVKSDFDRTLFDGKTPFTVELLYQETANRLIKFYFPNVVAPEVIPVANGLGRMSVTPQFGASQTPSAPMCTVTVRNTIAAYP